MAPRRPSTSRTSSGTTPARPRDAAARTRRGADARRSIERALAAPPAGRGRRPPAAACCPPRGRRHRRRRSGLHAKCRRGARVDRGLRAAPVPGRSDDRRRASCSWVRTGRRSVAGARQSWRLWHGATCHTRAHELGCAMARPWQPRATRRRRGVTSSPPAAAFERLGATPDVQAGRRNAPARAAPPGGDRPAGRRGPSCSPTS